MINQPRAGELTQGTLFTCAVAEEYDGCDVHGLVITARCDTANDKVEVYNYIPVVRFSDWVFRDGARILASRTARTVRADMRAILEDAGEAASILDHIEPRSVLKEVLVPGSDKKAVQRSDRFARLCERLEFADGVLSRGHEVSVRSMYESESKEAMRVINELVKNSISEYYYLPNVDPADKASGYVVLLREIRHMPRRLATLICRGLDHDSYKSYCASHQSRLSHISVGLEEIAWPVGLLRSPEVEHLMQRLTSLFARIGVADVPRAAIAMLGNQLPVTKSGGES